MLYYLKYTYSQKNISTMYTYIIIIHYYKCANGIAVVLFLLLYRTLGIVRLEVGTY